jgi:hypothetical protein
VTVLDTIIPEPPAQELVNTDKFHLTELIWGFNLYVVQEKSTDVSEGYTSKIFIENLREGRVLGGWIDVLLLSRS